MADERQESGPQPPPELARLPRGRHGLPREFVAHNQRERLIAGVAESVLERGFDGTTIADITREAAVSRRTFYEHFATKEECFLAAYEAVLEQLRDRFEEAFAQDEAWAVRMRDALAAMLEFLVVEPALARLAMVEPLVAGPSVVNSYDAALQSLIPFFQAGREEMDDGNDLPETTEETVAGGVLSLISRRVMAGGAADLEGVLPDLVEFALTPYVGAAEARRLARSS